MSFEIKQPKVLMLCKKNKQVADTAVEYLKNLLGDNLHVYKGHVGDPLPEDLRWLEFDYIISFLSPWIVPEYLINKAPLGAINFHPGPPEYPGTGCFNFALYDNVSEYGATCHFMAKVVDSGDIVSVKRFQVYPKDNVSTLINKTYAHMLALFYEIIDLILSDCKIPLAEREQWRGKARTRKELDALCEISFDMNKEEVERRVRATFFPGMPGPKLYLYGHTFKITED